MFILGDLTAQGARVQALVRGIQVTSLRHDSKPFFDSSLPGGGFFVNFDGFWTIRGVVSAGAFNVITLECDVDRYALFTNLFDFSAWIKKTVNENY